LELTPTQMEALTMYMGRKALGLSQKQIADHFQISDRQLRRWIVSPEGKAFITDQSVAIAKESLSEVLSVLTKRAVEGKTPKWMELYLRVTGVLNGSEVEVTVNQPEEDRSNEALKRRMAEVRKMIEEDDYGDRKKIQ
jgi:hypothetical protein